MNYYKKQKKEKYAKSSCFINENKVLLYLITYHLSFTMF